MKLVLTTKHKIKQEPDILKYVTRDGWVVGERQAFGDNEQDCTITLDTSEYLKSTRKRYGMSQQEMAWVIGVSRPTYSVLEKGIPRKGMGKTRELTLREYMIIESININHGYEDKDKII